MRLAHMDKYAPFVRMLMASKSFGQLSHEKLMGQCDALVADYLKKLAALFRKAMDTGSVRKMDPVYAALALEGVLHAFVAYWGKMAPSAAPTLDKKVEAVMKTYFDQILR
jgi:hypothetical protein